MSIDPHIATISNSLSASQCLEVAEEMERQAKQFRIVAEVAMGLKKQPWQIPKVKIKFKLPRRKSRWN